jgi:hypothetical protein
MYLQDVTKSDFFKFDRKVADEIAGNILSSDRTGEPTGKKTSGATLGEYYRWWRDKIAREAGIRLDPNRLFSPEQKTQLRTAVDGRCALCGEAVAQEDEEFDHYPIPYRNGGVTDVSNGRLVHAKCHPRGRPARDS